MSQAEAGHTELDRGGKPGQRDAEDSEGEEISLHCIAWHGMGQNDVAGSCAEAGSALVWPPLFPIAAELDASVRK